MSIFDPFDWTDTDEQAIGQVESWFAPDIDKYFGGIAGVIAGGLAVGEA